MESNQESNQEPNTLRGDTFVFVMLGWMAAVLSFISLPVVFAPVAVVLGLLATWRGARKQGLWIIIFAVLMLVLYLVLGSVIDVLLT